MMDLMEVKKFFGKSLQGRVWGTVVVGSREYPWQEWTGETMYSKLLSMDTETEPISAGKVPRLAVATVFDGEDCWLVPPCRLKDFVERHAGVNFVFHNCAFDWWVVYRTLQESSRQVARSWLKVADENRLSDTMLLDQLIRIAQGCPNPNPRNLAVVASDSTDIQELNKSDPWRLRYGEIIDVPWKQVDREAWEYAAKDSIATRLAFQVLRKTSRRLVREHRIPSDVVGRYGPLSIRIQIRAAIALQATYLRGINVDQQKRAKVEEALRKQLNGHVQRLEAIKEFAGIFRKDKSGQLLLTPGGKPRMQDKRLRKILGQVADQHELAVERTSSGEVSKARSVWEEHTDAAPFIASWLQLEETAKLLQFFKNLDEKRVHPRYCVLVRTGRTSCSSPNIQQMPRSDSFRELFVPRPGNVFLIIDYNSLELRTLAKVCLERFGFSVLAETIQVGRDPHAYTASLLENVSYEEYLGWKDTNPAAYKQSRQAAKAVNFGVPGGLGAESLSTYARNNYQVEMSVEEAGEFRQRFLEEIYPEVGKYLANDSVQVLRQNLKCTTHDLLRAFPTKSLRYALNRIVRGLRAPCGKPYDQILTKRTWRALQRINQNEDLELLFGNEQAGPELDRRLCLGTSTTLTGRVRGHTTFTQRHNTPFQGLAADGAKLAIWRLFRSGYRVVAHVHDEFVIELAPDQDLDKAARQVDAICCESMEELTGTVPVCCQYAIANCWSKRAELVKDQLGNIKVWQPMP